MKWALVVACTIGCAPPAPTIEAFDAKYAGYAKTTGGFVAGINDADDGCAKIGDTVDAPEGDAHLITFLVDTDEAGDCPQAAFPIWPDCGPARNLDEQACALYQRVVGGAVVAESTAAAGTLTLTRDDGANTCTFDVDVTFPEQQRVTMSFIVDDSGGFPRCGVP